jgi:hypothetical protein
MNAVTVLVVVEILLEGRSIVLTSLGKKVSHEDPRFSRVSKKARLRLAAIMGERYAAIASQPLARYNQHRGYLLLSVALPRRVVHCSERLAETQLEVWRRGTASAVVTVATSSLTAAPCRVPTKNVFG